MGGKEKTGRIADAPQSLLGHREHADLVYRAEAVFHRAHQAEARARVALEIEHRVDDVLEHARPRDGAFLRDVADEEERRARALGVARELRRALAHLGDRAGRRLQGFGPYRLDRIDHRHARLRRFQGADDALELRLGEQPHAADLEAQALRPARDLLGRLLAAHVEISLLQRRHRLQQQGRLADPWIAAEQYHLPRNQALAQSAVELAQAGRQALQVARDHLAQRERLGRRLARAGEAALGDGLGERAGRTA